MILDHLVWDLTLTLPKVNMCVINVELYEFFLCDRAIKVCQIKKMLILSFAGEYHIY